MPATAIDMCSVALLKIGAAPIIGFDDGTVEADVAGRLYEPSLEALLATYPWRFSLQRAELVQDTGGTGDVLPYAYVLPVDLVRLVSADRGAYRIMGRRLHADARPLKVTYQRRTDEADFPPHFRQALIARLAAEFCLPITESTSRAELLIKLAENGLRTARLIDSQQSTPGAVEDFTLIKARG